MSEKYTQEIREDNVVVLCDGEKITVEEIIERLNQLQEEVTKVNDIACTVIHALSLLRKLQVSDKKQNESLLNEVKVLNQKIDSLMNIQPQQCPNLN